MRCFVARTVVAVLALTIWAIPTNANSIPLPPTEAGFVDSETPDTNFFGLFSNIGILNFGNRKQISYVKFDLSSISDTIVITSLIFDAAWTSASQFFAPVTIDIFHVLDDSWLDESLTWNNRPSLNNFLGTLTLNSIDDALGLRQQWDLSDFDYAGDLQDNFLSIALAVRNPSSAGLGFSINPSISPFIEIVSAPIPDPIVIPEPNTFLLLGTGLAVMLGYGWRKRKHAARA